jgi:hypothetical protein
MYIELIQEEIATFNKGVVCTSKLLKKNAPFTKGGRV